MKYPIKYKLVSIILIIFIPMVLFSLFHYFSMRSGNTAYSVSRDYIAVLFVISLAALGASLLLSKSISRGITSLVAAMREVGNGNLSFELKPSGRDELSEVADAFNKMTASIREAGQKLQESSTFLSSVLEGIGEGVIVIDGDYRIVSANKGYCRQAGMSCQEIIGKHCYEVSHHSDEPCHRKENGCVCAVKGCFETGGHYRAIHIHHNKEGKPLYIETNAYPLRDESGAVVSAIETLLDVTDRMMLEKKLEETKERYRKLYDDAPDMMHSVDRNGLVIVCNTTLARTLGYDIDEILGRPLSGILAPESIPSCGRNLASLFETGSCEGEVTYVTRDGRKIPAYLRAKAVYSDGNFFVADAVSRDISEKKLLEAQLLQAQKLEAVGTLAGGIAHDFNNILTAIIGYGTLLDLGMTPNDPLRPYARQILASAGRASALTQSLLAFSRKQIIAPAPTDLNEVVLSVEKLLSRLIGEDIELRVEPAQGELVVMADRSQLDQLLMNLATNARDAMPEGGSLSIRAEHLTMDDSYAKLQGFGRPGNYALLSVTDSGIGMDEKTRERIFEPFFTSKEVGKGTGLGLSIAYGIVKQHNGFINAYSEPGKGTTFRVYFPLFASAIQKIPSHEAAAPKGGSETVLLTEDNTEVRVLLRKILEGAGYAVIEAKDGEDAVMKFREEKENVDLLLLDVIMPKKDGKKAYEEITALRPGTKALFMSGYTEDLIHRKGVLEEGLHFISKPVTPDTLIGKIREVLDT